MCPDNALTPNRLSWGVGHWVSWEPYWWWCAPACSGGGHHRATGAGTTTASSSRPVAAVHVPGCPIVPDANTRGWAGDAVVVSVPIAAVGVRVCRYGSDSGTELARRKWTRGRCAHGCGHRPRHYVFSKVMTWVAFDRAIKSVEKFGFRAPLEQWRALRDTIHRDVCAMGFDAGLNSFVDPMVRNCSMRASCCCRRSASCPRPTRGFAGHSQRSSST